MTSKNLAGSATSSSRRRGSRNDRAARVFSLCLLLALVFGSGGGTAKQSTALAASKAEPSLVLEGTHLYPVAWHESYPIVLPSGTVDKPGWKQVTVLFLVRGAVGRSPSTYLTLTSSQGWKYDVGLSPAGDEDAQVPAPANFTHCCALANTYVPKSVHNYYISFSDYAVHYAHVTQTKLFRGRVVSQRFRRNLWPTMKRQAFVHPRTVIYKGGPGVPVAFRGIRTFSGPFLDDKGKPTIRVRAQCAVFRYWNNTGYDRNVPIGGFELWLPNMVERISLTGYAFSLRTVRVFTVYSRQAQFAGAGEQQKCDPGIDTKYGGYIPPGSWEDVAFVLSVQPAPPYSRTGLGDVCRPDGGECLIGSPNLQDAIIVVSSGSTTGFGPFAWRTGQ